MADEKRIEIAIIGGGITGIVLALGLLRRNIRPTIYERAAGFTELGAGIGFTPNAERAMKALEPKVHECFRKVATQNKDDWFRYVEAFGTDRNGHPTEGQDELICNLYAGERGWETCRRQDFQRLVTDLLPEGCLLYGKKLVLVEDNPSADKIRLEFGDGSAAVCDIVIGCDGIKSRMRSLMFGLDASQPSYTHKYAYRGLLPMDEAQKAVGDEKANSRVMYMGPDAHVLSCPVAGGKLVNIAAFVTDPNPWVGEDGRMTAPATKAEAEEAFAGFGRSVRGLISLLPEQLDKWAIFDLHDQPPSTFVSGRLCLAGDAAHATAPHHGAGAGYGVEDSLVLAELLSALARKPLSAPLKEVLPKMLAIYNDVRYDRCQALGKSSRIVSEMYQWQDAETRNDVKKFNENLYARQHRIWDFDTDEMVRGSLKALDRVLGNLEV
ncbi:putative monooxygenase [Xylariaceae sp. FL0594]|nr:putative monooxygenase [Xylariaceae sp. FL0594]